MEKRAATRFENGTSQSIPWLALVACPPVSACRRHIMPQAGRALEILGRAIEYLSDELVHGASSLSPCDPQFEAVQLLMAINRQV